MFTGRGTPVRYLPKIPTKKNDGAPMLLFPDIIKDNFFDKPWMPVPIRVDKVANGQPTGIILPRRFPSLGGYTFNAKACYRVMLLNLLRYTGKKLWELCLLPLKPKIVRKWWRYTVDLIPLIPDYWDDQQYILESYLKSFLAFREDGEAEVHILEFLAETEKYINDRISSNSIRVVYKGKETDKELYKKKNGKIYPSIIEADFYSIRSGRSIRRPFIPLFLYDDLLECYIYNRTTAEKFFGIDNSDGTDNTDVSADNDYGSGRTSEDGKRRTVFGMRKKNEFKKATELDKKISGRVEPVGVYMYEELLAEGYIVKESGKSEIDFSVPVISENTINPLNTIDMDLLLDSEIYGEDTR